MHSLLLFVFCSSLCSNVHSDTIRLYLSGDVMLGRGVDQMLAHPGNSVLPDGKDLAKYARLAVAKNGPFPSYSERSQPEYIWNDMLDAFNVYQPDLKIINLETSVTASDDIRPPNSVGPGDYIRYRMNPDNVYALSALNTDNKLVCNLANNHILDFSEQGLLDTMSTLKSADIQYTGVATNLTDYFQPAVIELPHKGTRVFVFGVGTESAYLSADWMPDLDRPGVCMVDPYDLDSVPDIMDVIETRVLEYNRRFGNTLNDGNQIKNIIVLTMHWGVNWDYDISDEFRAFAHALIDYNGGENGVQIDVIHGHSSHHVKAFEVYRNKVIFYGTGDTVDDYEGFDHEKNGEYRMNPSLGFLYFVDLNAESGDVEDVILRGTKIKHFQVHYASNDELGWLRHTMKLECENKFDLALHSNDQDGSLRLKQT